LGTLKRDVYEKTEQQPPVDIALVHYQFEVIHPCLDGIGRLGCLLIMLIERDLLLEPLLYLSADFERDPRADPIDRGEVGMPVR
jgi:Fic family protein